MPFEASHDSPSRRQFDLGRRQQLRAPTYDFSGNSLRISLRLGIIKRRCRFSSESFSPTRATKTTNNS